MAIYDFEKSYKKAESRPLKEFGQPTEDTSLHCLMEDYLDSRDLSPDLAYHNNWYPSRNANDHYPRIVIPARSSKDLGFWQARAMEPEVRPRYSSPFGNRGDSIIEVQPFYKSSYDFEVAVTEGPMDALAIAELGVPCFATMGNKPSSDVWSYLTSLFMVYGRDVFVTVVPDRDSPEFGAKVVKELGGRGFRVKVINVPAKDFATLSYEQRTQVVKQRLG